MNETSVDIVSMAPNHYGVQIREGHSTTGHEVRIPPAVLDDLGLVDVDQSAVVREAVGFLLEREPATSIMGKFSLEDVARFFPEFYDELRDRLAAAG